VPRDPVELDPRTLFDRPGSVELEIGCGKGAFLVLAAEMYRDVNFLGVEIARPFARAAAERMARRGFDNVRIMHGDGGHLLQRVLAPGSLSAVHVFFPDPWPKMRHRKRRVFTPGFLDGAERVLAPGGMLCFATDFAEYYASMRAIADAHRGFERVIAYTWEGEGGVTNFERKYLRAGRTSHRATYRRSSAPSDTSRAG
jgi:tRNA (guanine-N7-)-methyltransferase